MFQKACLYTEGEKHGLSPPHLNELLLLLDDLLVLGHLTVQSLQLLPCPIGLSLASHGEYSTFVH